MAINVDKVLKHSELDTFLGGQLTAQANLLPDAWSRDSKPAREEALQRVLRELARRTPPVLESDIAELEDIKHAVKYGAAAYIYRLNVTRGGEEPVFAYQADRYEKMFRDELRSIQITTGTGAEVSGAGTITVNRR